MIFFRSIYLKPRLFLILGVLAVLFSLSGSSSILFLIAQTVLLALLVIFMIDVTLLFQRKNGLIGMRLTPERLSNGDENEIKIFIENKYPFDIYLKIVDEIPFQFQKRDLKFLTSLLPGEAKQLKYSLRPVERGEYSFGAVNVFASNVIGLAARKFVFSNAKMVPVYPSFLQMRKYELLAISNRLSDYGLKVIRRIGHSMEFEKIREYVKGDDYRTVN